jgi:hypothetical protein
VQGKLIFGFMHYKARSTLGFIAIKFVPEINEKQGQASITK